MSTLTHLCADDAAWAEAMLADWSNEECGRGNSSEADQRACGQSDASLWLRGFDAEQICANAGVVVLPAGAYEDPPAPLGAKRAAP